VFLKKHSREAERKRKEKKKTFTEANDLQAAG
jgi:hypothetical protein